MRILIIHNYYQDRGGEDEVFEQESRILSQTYPVERFIAKNRTGWKGWLQKVLLPWNFTESIRLKRAIRRFKPDIIHIHNLHYAIGPLIVRTIHRHGIPMVMTVHNYRLMCPSSILFHQNKLFLDSINANFPWLAIKKGVYNNSKLHTFWLALANTLHRRIGTWQMVNKYLVLTPFAKNLICRSSFPVSAHKWMIKPNFIAERHEENQHPLARGDHFLFIGRLEESKGIKVLLQTFSKTDLQVRIAGSGPLQDEVRRHATQYSNIKYLGPLVKTEIEHELATCTALIFPSIWYEGMPMTILESFASGTPVIASRLGAMESMITDNENGILFEPGNTDELLSILKKWHNNELDTKQKMRTHATKTYLQHYTQKENMQLLLEIYRSLIISVI